MDITKLTFEDVSELTLLKLSREIARNIHPLEQILERFGISPELWDVIRQNPRFTEFVRSETEAWESASSTDQRVRVKSLSMIEEALPEMYERMHDPREPLSSKVELFKTIGRFGGIGAGSIDGVGGDKLSVTINLGADNQLKFEKDVTPRVVDVMPE